MDHKAVKAVLETLSFAVEQAVVTHDRNALLLLDLVFRFILDQGKEFTLQVLHHLIECFED